MVFHSDKFIFDGKTSSSEGIALVDTSSNDVLMDYGIPFSNKIRVENSFGGNPFYTYEDSPPDTITLEFCLLENDSTGAIWTEEQEERILNWLVQDKFCEFQSMDYPDLYFYLIATKVKKKRNHELRGILEIEFQPYYKHPIKKIKKTTEVSDEKSVTINNSSISEKKVYPIFSIEALDNTECIIENTSFKNKKPLKISSLKKGQKIIIDNSMHLVIGENDENLFHLVDRNWVFLIKGINNLKVNGKVKIEIQCNLEVKL